MASLNPADIARALGLEDYQAELYVQLAEQAERQGIPLDVLPGFAKYLDRIDWEPILATPGEAADILGVTPRTLGDLVQSDLEWMRPFVWARDAKGDTIVRLWLGAKLRAFKKIYRPRSRG